MARINMDNARDCYDVIVAGGGLAGLTAANILAKNGHSVLLAEQHSQLGGLASFFKRKNHVFDVALHGFPIGMKKTLRKYWSQEMADHIVQVKSVRFDNPQFSIETSFTREDFTRILTNFFKIPAQTVRDFYNELEGMNYYDNSSMTNRELFEKYFPGRNDVVRLLMEPISYANGSNLDEPAITYGIVFSNFMSKGVYTFLGGTDLMLKMMEGELTRNSVSYATSSRIDKVLVEKGKVFGALINNKCIRCKSVISNGNILSTIFDWTGEKYFHPDYIQKTRNVRLNNSSCQVYIGLKQGEKLDFIGDILFTSEYPVFDPASLISPNISSRTYSIYYPEIRPGSFDSTVVASMNASYEYWSRMNDTEYKTAKNNLIRTTLNSLENYIPGISVKADYVEAATPVTFEKYTLHRKGASFGTKFEGLDISMKLSEQVAGLYHAGSVGIIMSGWLGAANYGVITANGVDKYLRNA